MKRNSKQSNYTYFLKKYTRVNLYRLENQTIARILVSLGQLSQWCDVRPGINKSWLTLSSSEHLQSPRRTHIHQVRFTVYRFLIGYFYLLSGQSEDFKRFPLFSARLKFFRKLRVISFLGQFFRNFFEKRIFLSRTHMTIFHFLAADSF